MYTFRPVLPRHEGESMVDIVVTGRKIDVATRLRAYAEQKLAKVDKLCPKAVRVDVEISRERNPRLSGIRERVQLTCLSRGPAIRAEAAADETIAAFDLAWAKLESRLRRAADRRRVRRGSRTPVSVAAATAPGAVSDLGPAAVGAAVEPSVAGAPTSLTAVDDEPVAAGSAYYAGEGPMIVREKLHVAAPMTLDQALYEMELVGHDFFLFCDKETGLPSVVYRRRGYDYGVIRVAPDHTPGHTTRPVPGQDAELTR